MAALLGIAALTFAACAPASAPLAGPFVADTPTATATVVRPTAPPLYTPTARPTPGIPVATDFRWFRPLAFEDGSPRVVCDQNLPFPANPQTNLGLCVRYHVTGVLGVQRKEWVLFRGEDIVQSGEVNVYNGNVPTPAGLSGTVLVAPLSPGTYRLVISYDNVRAGETSLSVR